MNPFEIQLFHIRNSYINSYDVYYAVNGAPCPKTARNWIKDYFSLN